MRHDPDGMQDWHAPMAAPTKSATNYADARTYLAGFHDGRGSAENPLRVPNTDVVTKRSPNIGLLYSISAQELLGTKIHPANDDVTRKEHDKQVYYQALNFYATGGLRIPKPLPGNAIQTPSDANMTYEEKQSHEAYRLQRLHDAGYEPNGDPGPVLKLMQNRHFQGFANNIALPMIEMYSASRVLTAPLVTEAQLAQSGAQLGIKQYGKDFALKLTSQYFINNGDVNKIDIGDVTLSTINPFKKYGFGGRVLTDALSAAVDIKADGIKTVLPINGNIISEKKPEDVWIDFAHSLAKSGTKETFSTLSGSNQARDYFIDYIMGKHKQMLKEAFKPTSLNNNDH
jgi:hypothetical protein